MLCVARLIHIACTERLINNAWLIDWCLFGKNQHTYKHNNTVKTQML